MGQGCGGGYTKDIGCPLFLTSTLDRDDYEGRPPLLQGEAGFGFCGTDWLRHFSHQEDVESK